MGLRLKNDWLTCAAASQPTVASFTTELEGESASPLPTSL